MSWCLTRGHPSASTSSIKKSTLCWWKWTNKRRTLTCKWVSISLGRSLRRSSFGHNRLCVKSTSPKTDRNEPSATENSLSTKQCTWRVFNYSGMKARKGKKPSSRGCYISRRSTSMKLMAVWWACNSIITMERWWENVVGDMASRGKRLPVEIHLVFKQISKKIPEYLSSSWWENFLRLSNPLKSSSWYHFYQRVLHFRLITQLHNNHAPNNNFHWSLALLVYLTRRFTNLRLHWFNLHPFVLSPSNSPLNPFINPLTTDWLWHFVSPNKKKLHYQIKDKSLFTVAVESHKKSSQSENHPRKS